LTQILQIFCHTSKDLTQTSGRSSLKNLPHFKTVKQVYGQTRLKTSWCKGLQVKNNIWFFNFPNIVFLQVFFNQNTMLSTYHLWLIKRIHNIIIPDREVEYSQFAELMIDSWQQHQSAGRRQRIFPDLYQSGPPHTHTHWSSKKR